MSSLDPVFSTKFSDEVTIAFDQVGSKLQDRVRVDNDVKGEAVNFPVVTSATSATTYVRGADLSWDGDNTSFKTATMAPVVAWRYVHELDRFQANADYRKPFTTGIAQELGRAIDRKILDAMAASSTSIGATANLDIARIAAVTSALEAAEVPEDDDVTWVVTPKVMAKIRQVAQFGSRDYNEGMPLKGGQRMVRFMGMNIITMNMLQSATYWTSSTDHNTYAFHRQSVGLGFAQQLTIRADYVPTKIATLIAGTMLAGAVSIQPLSVLQVKVNGL